MLTFAQGIARQEGYYIPGSRASRNNNPGNLNYAPWQQTYGAVLETIPHGYSETPRFASFPNAIQGAAAMAHLLLQDYLGLSIEDALNKWAPPIENQTNIYIKDVCLWSGKNPTDVLTPDDFSL